MAVLGVEGSFVNGDFLSESKDPLPENRNHPVLHALIAFLIWGLLPLYWKLFKHIPANHVLEHRILWSTLFLLLICWKLGGSTSIFRCFRNRETLIWILPSALLIGVNWYLYIWAVINNYVLETSLGYFLNPLLNVVLGAVFLGERLRKWQKVSVLLVTIAIANLFWNFGRLPWIALWLAVSFAFYGLFKKKTKTDALVGLTIETCILFFPALIAIYCQSQILISLSLFDVILLIGAGILSALPLLLFGMAAKKLRLSTLGLLQYIAPSLQFLLAVFVFKEPFSSATLVSFILIWMALFLYTWDSFRKTNLPSYRGL